MRPSLPIGFLVALAACTPPAPTASRLATDASDAAPYPDDDNGSDPCSVAARVLWNCHCPESGRTGGVAFPAFCRSRGAAIYTQCIVTRTSCSQLYECGVGCVQSTKAGVP